MEICDKLISYFEQFLYAAVLKEVKEQTICDKLKSEWIYFKTLLPKNVMSDTKRIQMYFDILSSSLNGNNNGKENNSYSYTLVGNDGNHISSDSNNNQAKKVPSPSSSLAIPGLKSQQNSQDSLKIATPLEKADTPENKQIMSQQQQQQIFSAQSNQLSAGLDTISSKLPSSVGLFQQNYLNYTADNSNVQQQQQQQQYMIQQTTKAVNSSPVENCNNNNNSNNFSSLGNIQGQLGSSNGISNNLAYQQSLNSNIEKQQQQAFPNKELSQEQSISSQPAQKPSEPFRFQRDKIKQNLKNILDTFNENNAILNLFYKNSQKVEITSENAENINYFQKQQYQDIVLSKNNSRNNNDPNAINNNYIKPITAPLAGNMKSNSSNQLDTNPYLLTGLTTTTTAGAANTFLNNSNNNNINLPSYQKRHSLAHPSSYMSQNAVNKTNITNYVGSQNLLGSSNPAGGLHRNNSSSNVLTQVQLFQPTSKLNFEINQFSWKKDNSNNNKSENS